MTGKIGANVSHSSRMTEPKRSTRRGTTRSRPDSDSLGDDNPYLDAPSRTKKAAAPSDSADAGETTDSPRTRRAPRSRKAASTVESALPGSRTRDTDEIPPAKAKRTTAAASAQRKSAVAEADNTPQSESSISQSAKRPAGSARKRSAAPSAVSNAVFDSESKETPKPAAGAVSSPQASLPYGESSVGFKGYGSAQAKDVTQKPPVQSSFFQHESPPPQQPRKSDFDLGPSNPFGYRRPSTGFRSAFDLSDRDPAEGPNRYDLAFDRTDGPERQGQTGASTPSERPYGQDRGERSERNDRSGRRRRGGGRHDRGSFSERPTGPTRAPQSEFAGERQDRYPRQDRGGGGGFRKNGRRGRNRFRPDTGGDLAGQEGTPTYSPGPATPVAVEGTMAGWFDPSRDGGFLRRAQNSYLPDPTDPFVAPALVRLHQLRRGDQLDVTYGRDHRGRYSVVTVEKLNDGSPVVLEKRPEFNTLTASYPDRKLTLETGRPAKSGPELTRRAIDLIAPIGYGQRALIVAPARAGKTTLLQAIVEGVAINHPQAVLLVLLVDERPEEVSEMITWGYGEVVASSFDMPPKRHVEVAEMTLERARRLVELGKDVVIVLDSITRLARAHNTVDRGTGRTMSGGLDATAMQKPKAFFGSARMIAPEHGGGSLTIIATALVETGSRMDDVIFEEFKGTGNCEIKLDRSLADRRIFPAFDIATSGTRREEKLYRPDQVEKIHILRRGLHQLPPQSGMEWLIKRIAGTPNNDSLLDGL